MNIVANFEQLIKYKAERMAKAASWEDQAGRLNCDFKAFKVGGWDAMIYDMAFSLGCLLYTSPSPRD